MALLEPQVERIDGADGARAADAAPDWVAAGTPEPLRSALVDALGPDRVLTRALDLVRYASDASPYRQIPKAVVRPRDTDEVVALMRAARHAGAPLVFRAGGTSLNGQSQTDGILVDVRRHWAGVEVLDGGRRARVRPGTVLGHVNRLLAPHGRRLGPDPASTDIACAGGVIANNSGGMRCGVVADSYSTLESLTFVTAAGSVVDTAAPDAASDFERREPDLARGLAEIRDEIRSDAELSERIRRKFGIKNTTGYRLCAFLDADAPVEIFRRLLVGSEGTLAFVAEAVFETVRVPACTTVSWLHFPDIDSAVAPVPGLVAAGATAVELMVAPALMVASHNIAGTPQDWRELPLDSAVLLVEFGADTDAELDDLERRALDAVPPDALIRPPAFTRDPHEVELSWHVREAMHGLVGRLRPPGTALIVEDVCVRPERVAEAARDVQVLLGEHGFLTGVAGHASAGNLHFMLTPDFAKSEDRERYEAFMEGLVELIVEKYDGSLKAEHGTGLNMAPYLEREWGGRATEIMWRIKRLADPDGVLAPGVLLNRDPGVHLRNLKTTPEIEEVATTCVECGFCEPVCPSRDLTTTPRQRIVVRREMARQAAGSPVHRALLEQYEYDGIETCAADGTCAIACPLSIDTGKLIKEFRARERTPRAERTGLRLARRWSAVERAARAALHAGGALGGAPGRAGSALARAAVSHELVPAWPRRMPPPAAPRLPATERDGAAAVYLPACVNRIFGNARGTAPSPTLPEAMVAVSRRAGAPVWIPPDAPGHCCATPWTSKGLRTGGEHMARRLSDSLWRWTEGGRLPVVMDASSCALGVRDEVGGMLDEERSERHGRLEILDSIEWGDRLLPGLEVRRRVRSAAVHPTCAARHMELQRTLARLAAELAEEVTVPIVATCCGMAGDRGMLHPELAEAATAPQRAELDGRRFEAHLSSNRTCEIALQETSGRPYRSVVLLLEELTR